MQVRTPKFIVFNLTMFFLLPFALGQIVMANELDGVWELESYTNEGVKKPATDPNTTFHRQRILIKGNQWVEWYSGKSKPPAKDGRVLFRYETKAGMPFRHFDYWPVGADDLPDTWKKIGIYKIEGDRLKICFRVQPIPGKSVTRPRTLDAEKGMGTGLAVYKRVKSK